MEIFWYGEHALENDKLSKLSQTKFSFLSLKFLFFVMKFSTWCTNVFSFYVFSVPSHFWCVGICACVLAQANRIWKIYLVPGHLDAS